MDDGWIALGADRIDEWADPAREYVDGWRSQARPEQLPPLEDYRTFYLRGGRGSGKTWAASHLFAEWVLTDPEPGEWGIVSPTYPDAWSVAVEGESGFLAALGTTAEEVRRGASRLVEHWHRSFAEIRLRSGHIIRVASAQDGGLRIQGKNLKAAWCDEIGLWDNWQTTWDESLKFAVRKGEARIIATGTPKQSRKARKLVKRLIDDPKVPVARLRTVDNAANLSQRFLDEVVGAAKGTRLEQQELEGVLLDDVEGALWTAENIEDYRVKGPPDDLLRVVVAVDPAVSSGEDSDEAGIVVIGEGDGGHGFVLADYSMRGTPDEWIRKAVWAYRHHQADCVVAEKNNGGDFIPLLLHTVDTGVPCRLVWASRGKRTRAEPVSALYEQGRIHHCGVFTMLEEQMVTWVPTDPDSPDRVDALCWGVHELKGLTAGSWLAAYGTVRCEDCQAAYPESYGACPRCHPELARRPARGAKPAGTPAGEPAALSGWAAIYGAVRCPQGHTWVAKAHKTCPKCCPGGGMAVHPSRGPLAGLPLIGRRW